MLCLPSNEPHYLNIKVEAHSIYLCLTVFLFAAGSTENHPTHSMETVTLRSSLSGNWRERVAPNKQTGSQAEFLYHVYKKGKNPEVEKCFKFCCGFSNPLGTCFGGKLSSKYQTVHFKHLPKGSSTSFTCKKVPKRLSKEP